MYETDKGLKSIDLNGPKLKQSPWSYIKFRENKRALIKKQKWKRQKSWN